MIKCILNVDLGLIGFKIDTISKAEKKMPENKIVIYYSDYYFTLILNWVVKAVSNLEVINKVFRDYNG